MVNGIDDEIGPMKAEELWNLPYPKHTWRGGKVD